jgi:hypothetical protein
MNIPQATILFRSPSNGQIDSFDPVMIHRCIQENSKIPLIRLYLSLTGLDLMRARDAVHACCKIIPDPWGGDGKRELIEEKVWELLLACPVLYKSVPPPSPNERKLLNDELRKKIEEILSLNESAYPEINPIPLLIAELSRAQNKLDNGLNPFKE